MFTHLNGKRVVIFGGSGFIGNHLVNKLCQQSCQIKIISRNPDTKKNCFFSSEPGQVSVSKIDEYNEENIKKNLIGADIVINLIGILYESKNSKFNFTHIEIPKLIAKTAKYCKVQAFIHLSALNVEKSQNSLYATSKLMGENAVNSFFPDAVILKPSVVFGKGDNFTNLFSKISRFSPFIPIIGTPKINFKNYIPRLNFSFRVKFQPIYVGDLVKFIIYVSNKKAETFELAGPSIKSFDEIYDVILKIKKRKRIYLPLPFFLAELFAFFSGLLPKPIITSDQLKLLSVDSISDQGLNNLVKVVKIPKSMEVTLKNYI